MKDLRGDGGLSCNGVVSTCCMQHCDQRRQRHEDLTVGVSVGQRVSEGGVVSSALQGREYLKGS